MSGPTPVTPELLRGTPLPRHEEGQDKDQRGRVLVVAGSVEVPGAALLSGIGALRAGAGKLQIATCRSIAPHMGLAAPEALVAGLDETPGGGISADEAGAAWSCDQGNVGLATSGSGDTLAGVITGLAARGASPVQATLWGVFLHGEAGNRLARKRGPVGFLARELLAEIPSIMAELDAAGPAA